VKRARGLPYPGIVAATLAAAACASGGAPDELYKRARAEEKHGAWAEAAGDLEAFMKKACPAPPAPPAAPAPRCKEAARALARVDEHQGAVAQAWVALDTALAFPPHGSDEDVRADLARVEEAFMAKQGDGSARGPVIVRYRDEVSEIYNPRSLAVSVDFKGVFNKDKNASELHGDWVQVFGGSLPAGEHVLTIEAGHSCNPAAGGSGTRCARSTIRRSWPFQSQARSPIMIEITAVTESGEGDGPDHPALEYHEH
jgi:hypothetical protein